MKNLTYVTGNYGKYVSVKEKFEKNGIEINFANIDIDEPNINDIEIISKEKARIAFEQVKSDVFVIDCGFYIRNFPNNPYYPGAFVKRSGVSSNVEKVLDEMSGVEDRYCYFLDCLTYYDGNEFIQFFGKSEGTISYEQRGNQLKKAKSNLWYIFVPKDSNKTLAEMNDFERNNSNKDKVDATLDFINYIKERKMSEQPKSYSLSRKK